MSSNSELFPAIGSVAEQTQKLPVEPQTVEVTLDEERPVQEIESLCMRCEEQVRSISASSKGFERESTDEMII